MFKAFKMLMLNFRGVGGGGVESKGVVGPSTETADELGSAPLQFKENGIVWGGKRDFLVFVFSGK